MKRLEAEEIVEKTMAEVEDFYREVRRQLAEHEATARMRIRKWVELGEYRRFAKELNPRPAVALYSPQYTYDFGLSNWRQRFKKPPEEKKE